MRISILSPHRDDAAFSLTLSIETWLRVGHSIQIINCFTKSRYAPFLSEALESGRNVVDFVSALRKVEDERWRDHVGPDISFLDLNLKDAPLRLGCSIDEVCGLPVPPEDEAVDTIHAALENGTSDALLVPLAIGRHVDHTAARQAASPLVASRPTAFYEDLPYAGRPHAAEEIAVYANDIRPRLQPVFVGPPLEPSPAAECVRVATREYRSQVDGKTIEQIAGFRSRYLGRERVWANSLWQTSPLMWTDRTDMQTQQ